MFTLNDNMEVTALDGVPDEFKSFYKEKDDGSGYMVDTSNAVIKVSVENIGKLGRTVKALRGEVDEAKKKSKQVDLSALGEYGESVESIAETIKSKIEDLTGQLETATKGGKVNIEKIKEELAKTHADGLKQKDSRIEALTKQLYTLMVENEAASAITKANGDSTLLMPFVKSQVKVSEADGKFKVDVVDSAGDIKFSGHTGQPMTLNELVVSMKEDKQYQRLFNSDNSSGGGGSSNNETKQKTYTQMNKNEMTSTQKISAGLKKGQFLGKSHA